MSHYTRANFKEDVKDMAAEHGLSPNLESRFARTNLGLEKSGVSYFKFAPDFRAPFGHTHTEQEEIYVVISGSAVVRVEDDEVQLGTLDAIRVAPSAMRAIQGGPDGCELIAIGAPSTDNKDAEVQPGWWG